MVEPVPIPNVPIPNVVVGLTHGQDPAVVREAAMMADRLDAVLVCAHVDSARYITDVLPDGTVMSMPLDPDLAEDEETTTDPELIEQVRSSLAESGQERELVFRELAGDPALALADLAETVQATYIVVGGRRRGLRAGMKEFFGGSVAAHLVHRQCRPVLVVPVEAIQRENPLPWEADPS